MRDMRFIIGFLVAIGLLILVIVLLVGGGGGNKSKPPNAPKPLASYASTDAVTRLTVDGPITAEQDHRQQRISVSRDQVVYEEVNGYEGHVVKSRVYPSSQSAYENFLHALAVAGFTNVDNSSELKDERGYCATDNRYIFELSQDGQQIERAWSSSCGKPKTYEGNLDLTLNLFQSQVPDYDQVVSGDYELF